MDTPELLLTTSRHTQQNSACLWDYRTGNTLHFFKNGSTIAPKTLNLLGNDFLIAADDSKPLIHVWQLNSQEPNKKLLTILPEKATALAICPRNAYIAAGIGPKLYIWHIASGHLLAVQKRNYQPITNVKFSSCGHYLIVAGRDGMLIGYDFVKLVDFHARDSERGQVPPIWSRNDHSMPITDLHVGVFGAKARLATVSSDQTCKIYSLQTGEPLLTLVFSEPLTAVVFDAACWNLYVGAHSGKIRQFSLREPPRTIEHHVDDGGALTFEGHEQTVTCLDLNLSNTNLVSGSEDKFVFVWEIQSRQILRRIEHKESITNVKFVLNHGNFFAQNFKPKLVVRNFDRELLEGEVFEERKLQDYDLSDEDEDEASETSEEWKNECLKLKQINKQLYNVALELSGKVHNF